MKRIDVKEKDRQYRIRLALYTLLRSVWSFGSSNHGDWRKVAHIGNPSIDDKRISWLVHTGPSPKTAAMKWDMDSQIDAFLDTIIPETIMDHLVLPVVNLRFKTGNKGQFKITFRRSGFGVSLRTFISEPHQWNTNWTHADGPLARYFETLRVGTVRTLALHDK